MLRGNSWWIRRGLLLKWVIISDVRYIVVRMVIVRKKIVIIRWKRWKTLNKVRVVICGLVIIC